ncbi:MAG: phosphatidate cytidylyltransferase [Gammaproteobacteria bacterium]|nr:phosphatidate cytidylyltransferase [Gammaproteobacteria bacterium]
MLKQRIITALILAPAAIWLVLFASTQVLGVALGLVVLLGALEWARLAGYSEPLGRALFLIALTLLMVAAEAWRRDQGGQWIYLAASLWWLGVLGLLLRRRQGNLGEAQGKSPLALLAGVLVLLPAWLAMVELHQRQPAGPGLLLFVLLMIWLADIGAYFAGRRFGKTKLAPAISPGKTLEGVYGAMFSLLLSGLALYLWGVLPQLGLLPLLLLCLLVGLFSIVGDLFESLLKRRRGVKDSGKLLPGHGGVLDRIDSLTAALPLFLFGLNLLGAA